MVVVHALAWFFLLYFVLVYGGRVVLQLLAMP